MNQQELIQKIKPILERHQIRKAYIFGSFARGEQTPESDVDIIVELGYRPMGLFAFTGMSLELEHVLGRDVDLVTPTGLCKYIKDRVLSEAKIIYER